MESHSEIYRKVLDTAGRHARNWIDAIPSRDVNPSQDADQIRAALGEELPAGPTDPVAVVDRLGRLGEPGLMSMASGRFFGWVIGGTLPAALGADWLVTLPVTWPCNWLAIALAVALGSTVWAESGVLASRAAATTAPDAIPRRGIERALMERAPDWPAPG